MRIGFIGVGQMGAAMAERLLGAGHALSVWNRSPAAVERLCAQGASAAAAPRDTLANDVVISMLADDAAVRSIWVDSALIAAMPAGATHVNMASISVALGRQLAQAHRSHGSGYVAAPVFGRPEAARRGELDIVAAGSGAALTRCRTLFETLGRRWFDVGREPHEANAVKIARNFVLATIIESLGEAFALLAATGTSAEKFLDIITSTSMSAPAYKDYGRRMLVQPAAATFPLRLGLKDVELALAAARESGIALPSAELIQRQHLGAIAEGYGDKDWAALGNWIMARAQTP
jgi:3-hydroxyisobutyrate dehydrogenase-like beta-hydroxyacid dehydrogenase